MKQRVKIIPFAKGNVLEIGIGSGLNLLFYLKENVKHLMQLTLLKKFGIKILLI